MSTFKSLLYFIFTIHVTSIRTEVEEGESQNAPCTLAGSRSFSEYLQCIHHRSKRRTFNPYDWGPTKDNPCHHYVMINQPERRVSNVIDKLTDSVLCDRALKRRWYRFDSSAGAMMPEKCVDEFSCGTHAPIWLNGRHPPNNGDIQDMEVCLSLAGHCCNRRWRIRVANCGQFYSYLLVDTPGCFMAYCVGGELPCPPGQSSPTGFSPGCSADYPLLNGDVNLEVGKEGHNVIIYCDYTGRIPRGALINVDWYVLEDNADKGDEDEYPVWTDRMVERRRSKFVEGRWMGKMGSTIYCKMRGVWRNNTGVPGLPIASKKFYAGIEILERKVTIDEASDEAVISLRSTLPISCLPQFEDACSLTLQVAHDQRYTTKRCIDGQVRQVVFGDCAIEITPKNWKDVHEVKVKAVRDFYYDGNKRMKVGFKPTYSTVLSPVWKNYEVPAIDVIAKDAPTKMCFSTGDPHYVTFDGLYYHVYLEGEFVLYKNTRLPVQINTRMEKCGKSVTCNCGVAVKAGDDVIVIDRCMRRKRNLAYGESFPDGWRTLHRHALEQGRDFTKGLTIYEYDEGKRFTVHLPTGGYIDFKVGEKWIDIYMYASSDDYMSTAGLCGTFNNKKDDDFLFPDRITRTTPRTGEACGESSDVCKFAESWRVDQKNSFFGPIVEVPLEDAAFTHDEQYCKCEEFGRSSTIVCNYHYDVDNCQARVTQRGGHDRTRDLVHRTRSKRSAELDDEDDDYFNSQFVFDESFKGKEPSWPTPSGITEQSARDYCRRIIEHSAAGAVCTERVSDIDTMIDACLTDIKVTDDLDWALSALTSLTEECTRAVHNEARLWEEPVEVVGGANEEEGEESGAVNLTTPRPQTTTTAPRRPTYGQEILQRVCPSDCSRQGQCIAGKCSCHPDFLGSDCSISRRKQPTIIHLSSGGLCDVTKKACEFVRVYGTYFRNTSTLSCHFTSLQLSQDGPAVPGDEVKTVPGYFDTFEEVLCRLPQGERLGSDMFSRAYSLHVSLDDYHKTDEEVFILYDSRCQTCNVNGNLSSCLPNEDSCIISGSCFGPHDRNPANCCQVCEPSVSRDSFQPGKVPDPPKLLPAQLTHLTKKGQPWELTVRAEDDCLSHLTVNTDSASSLDHRQVSDSTVSLSSLSVTTGRYSADVTAVDECGATTRRKYELLVMEDSVDMVHSRARSGRLCDGNVAPSFGVYPGNRLLVHTVTNEELSMELEGEEPDDDGQLEYFRSDSAQSDADVTVTRDGHLSIVAPSTVGETSYTITAVDVCNQHAFLTVHVITRSCDCQNGGRCRSLGGRPWSRRAYKCICRPGYTGRRCDVKRSRGRK